MSLMFEIWEGDGFNGKGLLTKTCRTALGSYYSEAGLGLLTERNRNPNNQAQHGML